MINRSPNISSLIQAYLPDHVIAKYPQFVDFAKAYFDFLEYSNQASFYINTIPDQRSIYLQQDEFLQYIQRELGIFVPRIYAADPKVFYDKITEMWRSKGSEEAIKTFFLMFLDDVVEVSYPWANVLIPSDGRWIKEQILRVVMKQGNANDFLGKRIKQISSDASAIVSKVESRTYSDGIIYELTLVKNSLNRMFDPQQELVLVGNPNVRAEIYRSLSSFTIVNPGVGYKVGDRISIKGFEGFTFVAYVSSVSLTGEILDVEITNFGSGNTPIFVRIANIDKPVPDKYYLKDFILYEYLDDQRDGPASNWADLLIGQVTPTILNVTDAPDLSETSTIFDHDYVEVNGIFFAEDYVGESSTLTETIPGIGDDEIRKVVVTVSSETGVGAVLTLNFDAITGYPGRYIGVHGQLDESIVLQDSYYYQKYSYEVKTTFAATNWINQLTRAVHPAGTKVFGNVSIYNKLNSKIKSTQVFIDRSIPSTSAIIEKLTISGYMLGATQNYTEASGIYFAEDYVGVKVFDEQDFSGVIDTIDTFTPESTESI